MDSTWLGGVATYTTATYQCTEMVYYPSVTIARCLDLVLQFQSMLSCDLCFHWNDFISCLYDVRFDTFPYYDDQNVIGNVLYFVGLSYALILACYVSLGLCCSMFLQ